VKYSELGSTRFVKDDTWLWTVTWWDGEDTSLSKLRRLDQPWENAVESIVKGPPDKLIVHPGSPILDCFTVEEAPPPEILRMLETARRKRFQMDFGSEFCASDCAPMRTLLTELFVAVVRSSLALGCRPEWMQKDIAKMAEIHNAKDVVVDTIGDAVREMEASLERVKNGQLGSSVVLHLKKDPAPPAQEEGK